MKKPLLSFLRNSCIVLPFFILPSIALASEEATSEESQEQVAQAVAVTGYYEIKDPFITNLSSTGNKLNYIKAQVVIVLLDSRDIPLLEEHEALIKNAIVTTLGSATYAEASQDSGRTKLIESCKKSVTEITDQVIGRRIVKNVMFTSYLVQ